jgi:hypothetical protein
VAAVVYRLEPRVLLAANAPAAGLLAIPSDNLRHGRHDFADTWHPLSVVTRPSPRAVSYLHVNDFAPFSLDEADLRSTLALAPMEFTPAAQQPVELSIPGADGGPAQRFAVVQTLVMDPKLAAKFPGIKTYRAQGIDDPAATARFDLTPLGFHAEVLSPLGAYYIDPYWHLKKTTYAAYSRHDLIGRPGEDVHLIDDIDRASETAETPGGLTTPVVETGLEADRSSGTQLRTYRAAVAATGEYTAFFGGTVAAGQAAIVTAINRVNEVYESELAIRLTLVANNNLLVYTNASTDPYTNDNGSTMLGQNQTNITSVIGSANYDIGHVFSTGGGGIAAVRSVGVSSVKARGVTGLSAPVGDAFVIDYVTHEMGHQFGGNHTFNTSKDPNRNASTAYEPGSGSTIMAYAGLEGSDDLQPHSDPYFAWKSFDEIITYVDSTIPKVGTRVSTGNAAPTVNAGADRTIPANTPFALTATGSDANNDPLTYSWEESDLGAARLLTDPDNGSSPLFRVYNPTASPTRTFPKLSSILSGANATSASTTFPTSLVERLPSVARAAMKFRVTARDNRAGGAGVNNDDMVVTVVNSGAGFLITSQNSAVSYAGGSSQAVTWDTSGTTANGINAANVNIRLSTDGGNTFPTLLASNVANDGSEVVTIPTTPTTQARIKVEPTNNIFFDINNANFTITAAISPSATPGTPDLVAATDAGALNNDDLTNRDNSSAAKNLQFSVSGTVSGASVSIYSSGTLIGSAVAGGSNTIVTTNGTVDLADGGRSITARQTESGKAESADSAALSVTIDTAAPTADIADVSPDPRSSGVSSVNVVFSEAVANVDVSDFSLTRSDANIPLTVDQSPTSADDITFTVPSLLSLTSVSGTYVLSVSFAPPLGITDLAGNGLAAPASDTWVHSLPAWLSASDTAASWNSQSRALAITGAATIIADPASDTPAVSASGASAMLTINPAGGSVVNLAALALADGAVATMTTHGTGPVRTLALDGNPTIAAGTKLDLTDNVLVVRNGNLAGIQSQVAASFADGAWTGTGGITSATAAADPGNSTGLGIASNGTLSRTSFAGVTGLTSAAVFVKYTYYGDSDLSGHTTLDDFTLFLGGYHNSGTTWLRGDYDFSGSVTLDDFTLFLKGYQNQAAPL